MSNNGNNTGLPPPTKLGHIGSPAQAAYNARHQQNISQFGHLHCECRETLEYIIVTQNSRKNRGVWFVAHARRRDV